MTTKLFLELSGLFGGLLALGFVACLPLFNGQVRLFVQSKLFTKLVFWIPIYVIFCLVITGGLIAAGIVSSLLIVFSYTSTHCLMLFLNMLSVLFDL